MSRDLNLSTSPKNLKKQMIKTQKRTTKAEKKSTLPAWRELCNFFFVISILDLGVLILDLGVLIFRSCIFNFGSWSFDFGSWSFDFGSCIFNFGSRSFDFGSWSFDYGCPYSLVGFFFEWVWVEGSNVKCLEPFLLVCLQNS